VIVSRYKILKGILNTSAYTVIALVYAGVVTGDGVVNSSS